MPDIDNGAFNRRTCFEIRDCAVHPRAIAVLLDAVDDARAHVHLGGVVAVKGTQDGGCGGLVGGSGGELVGDFVDERFEAEHVAEELAFVAFGVGHAAGFVHLVYVVSVLR